MQLAVQRAGAVVHNGGVLQIRHGRTVVLQLLPTPGHIRILHIGAVNHLQALRRDAFAQQLAGGGVHHIAGLIQMQPLGRQLPLHRIPKFGKRRALGRRFAQRAVDVGHHILPVDAGDGLRLGRCLLHPLRPIGRHRVAQSLKITDGTLRRQAEGIGQIHLISAHRSAPTSPPQTARAPAPLAAVRCPIAGRPPAGDRPPLHSCRLRRWLGRVA